MWLTEEIGELATALRSGSHEERSLEFADVLAWLATIANVVDVDLEEAVARKYAAGRVLVVVHLADQSLEFTKGHRGACPARSGSGLCRGTNQG